MQQVPIQAYLHACSSSSMLFQVAVLDQQLSVDSLFLHSCGPVMTFLFVQLPWHRLVYWQQVVMALSGATWLASSNADEISIRSVMVVYGAMYYFTWSHELLHRESFAAFSQLHRRNQANSKASPVVTPANTPILM